MTLGKDLGPLNSHPVFIVMGGRVFRAVVFDRIFTSAVEGELGGLALRAIVVVVLIVLLCLITNLAPDFFFEEFCFFPLSEFFPVFREISVMLLGSLSSSRYRDCTLGRSLALRSLMV